MSVVEGVSCFGVRPMVGEVWLAVRRLVGG